nr:hypothetical protein FVER53263_13421 [Fusarium verticillioides]
MILRSHFDVEDICIGVTDANRGESSLQTIGFFLNLLPLRFNVQKDVKFSDLVAKTAQHCRTAQANMEVPFDVILDKANVVREPTSTPIFQVAINYRQGKFSKIPLGGRNLEFKDGIEAQSPYDLAFSITPNNDTTYVQIVAREDLYTREGTDTLLSAYMALLHDASRDVSKCLESINLYDQVGIDKALSLGYGDVVDYDWPSTLTEKVDETIKRYPHDVAVKDGTIQLTYGEVAAKVNGLASIIQSQLRPGSPLPDERLKIIFDAVAPGLMLCEDYTKQRAHDIPAGGPILSVTDIHGTVETITAANLERVNETTFILFTSGSTGTPKGIRLLPRGIINYVATKRSKLSLGREVVLQQSALGFDMSLAQAFLALALGGTLVIAPSAIRGDPLALGKLMADEGVTFTLGTPTEYLMIIRRGGQDVKEMQSWRSAISGGEVITAQLKASFRSLQQPPILTDFYGPTEIACCATIQTIDLENDGDDSVYIYVGPANPNTAIYILDESGHVVPQGLTGEICVSGVGVALSYLDDKSNSQKFVPNPFTTAKYIKKVWTTMYRTGDKGLIRANGGLQFVGRMDGNTTVKLRGLCVDLDDVTNTMLQKFGDSLEDVVVTVRGDPAFLVAHVVLTRGTSMDASKLQELASTLPLPQYMRPEMVIQLEKLPLNRSGKVDRLAIAALPLPTTSVLSAPLKKVSDRKPMLIEGELRLIWHNVLSQAGLANTARLSPDTDFFHVGGNSLLLVRLRSAIEISMGVTLPLSDMYRSSTLAGMAGLIARQKSSSFVPGPERTHVGTQKRHAPAPSSHYLHYHSRGISGHCLNNYSTLRAPSVESTRQMGLFALGRRIPIHYTSSNRVTLLVSSADAALPPGSVRDHQPPTDETEGFTAAKWAGEVFLEQLSEAAAASDKAPIENALNALLRYSKLTNAVPRVSSLSVGGYFDFLPVTDVADSLVEFVQSSQGTHSGVAFKHYSSGVQMPPTDFASYMQKTYGDESRELDLGVWIEEARRDGIEELVVLYL